jgi:hypothetical protein
MALKIAVTHVDMLTFMVRVCFKQALKIIVDKLMGQLQVVAPDKTMQTPGKKKFW